MAARMIWARVASPRSARRPASGRGGGAVLGTLMVLSGITELTDVWIFALNLTTAMGIGLGIDYSLFIVSRFREELKAETSTPDAVVRTVTTAGRTVLFSGMTVAISLAALFVFPMYFLRSFPYAGIAVVGMAVLGAIVFLPALLALLGPRVNALSIRRTKSEGVAGFWHNAATFVMRFPVPIATGVVLFLAVLGAPFLNVQFGLPDDRVLPAEVSSRSAQDDIRDNFASFEAGALSVVAPQASLDQGGLASLSGYAQRLSAVDGVARVDALTGSYAGGSLVFPAGPASQRFAGDSGTGCRWSRPASPSPPRGTNWSPTYEPWMPRSTSSWPDRAPIWSTPKPASLPGFRGRLR